MSELIDRQAAIVEIAKKEKILPYYSNGERPSEAYFNAGLHAAMGIIQSQPTASPWHTVEEPPKIGQNVLTMDANEDMETATYDGERFEDSYGFYITDVLYWMPIEPPKEDA